MSIGQVRLLVLLLLPLIAGCDRSGSAPAGTSDTGAKTTTAPDVPANASEPVFVDVAAEAGLNTVIYCGGPNKDHILESTGSGCAWIDYDEDGKPDIFLVNAWALDEEPSRVRIKGKSALYRNLGNGHFEDVTEQAGVGDDSWGCGVCAADYDNDGHVDLYVTCFGANRLYHNRGDGTFEEVAAAAGVAAGGWSTGAAFFDADGDGNLDLYVASYIDCTMEEVLAAERTNTWRDKVKVMAGPFGMRGGRDHFYHNNGDGTFSDWTDQVGMTDTAESYGLGVLASDLDNDGDVDVYVANDSNTNFLYRNDGHGTFTEIGGWSGAGLSAEGRPQAGMGVDAGDVDGDGLQDIIVTNFAQDYATLYHNGGKLFFTDVSRAQQLTKVTYDAVKWGCALFDFDQDADLDLLIINGHIYPQVESEPSLHESYRQKPTLLRNDSGHWTDVSRSAGPGMQIAIAGRGLALADFDDDGDLDLLVTGIDSPPLLLRNDTRGAGHWLKVRLLNRHGSPAINAKALVTSGGKTQLREVRSGSTYCSQNFFDLHFGLGVAREVESLEIRWPNGEKTTRRHVPVDGTVEIRQPAEAGSK